MRRVLSAMGVVCATVLTGGLLLAQQPPPSDQPPPPPSRAHDPSSAGGQPKGGWMAPGGDGVEGFIVDRLINDAEMGKQLNLTQDQTDKLRTLRADMQKQMVDLRDRMEKAARKQAELVSATTPDEAAVMKAVDDTGAARTAIAKVQVRHLLDVMKVLTPDQQQKLKDMRRDQMQTRRAEFRDKRREAGAGSSPSSTAPVPGGVPPPPPANQ